MSIIETSALGTQVYKVLRSDIIRGIFAPGDKLDINELATKFGVSRSPVKEAVNQLVHEGLIEIVPRRGTYISQLRFKDCMEALEARFMVEIWAASQIIDHITDEQINIWEQIIQKMDSLLKEDTFSYEEYSQLDVEFHQLIVKWTGNQKVQNIYQSINPLISLARIGFNEVFEKSVKRHKDHHNMLEALKNRNLAGLVEALQQHQDSLKIDTKLNWNEELYGPIE
ncbi:GntR family transcriptional regulator [Mesobacillus foraminis]|uniref:DNA-binding GntR family transcriptional regulator n=1 Tax=Mesobacillus foraminis TaxID=279826 RepID=A0A4R2AZS3_9BACI|nr:GntR family transcriptional regulator [Mesobacillus foraminis]TCN18419.1 DNA-binding GntR family transcriptional regulator [Mesobacillus foraminis]